MRQAICFPASVLLGTALIVLASTASAQPARITNASIRATLATNQNLIVGLTLLGGEQPLLLRAVGPGLAAFNVSGFMTQPRLTLYRGSSIVATNAGWGGTSALKATFSRVGAFPLVDSSADAALEANLSGGYTAHVSGPAGTVLVEAYDTGATPSARLVNLSARNRVGTGNDVLIAGITLTGTLPRRLLVRAIGPGLGQFGVTGVLGQPRLQIFDSRQVRLAEFTKWEAPLAAAFAATGAFPLPAGSPDVAAIIEAPPGSYTLQVSGVDNGVGEAMVEVYELPSS